MELLEAHEASGVYINQWYPLPITAVPGEDRCLQATMRALKR